MNTNKKLIHLALGVYAVVAIITYGNAIDHFYTKGEMEIAECRITAEDPIFCTMHRSTGAAGAVSAIVWPLYWSYRLQRSEECTTKI